MGCYPPAGCSARFQCFHGGCISTRPKCADDNPCTTDQCHFSSYECTFTPLDCADADACTTDGCLGGLCTRTLRSCDDGSLCTTDSCNPATGCVNLPITCNDNDACTTDACVGGACTFTPMVCDDSDPCTTDGCTNGVCRFDSACATDPDDVDGQTFTIPWTDTSWSSFGPWATEVAVASTVGAGDVDDFALTAPSHYNSDGTYLWCTTMGITVRVTPTADVYGNPISGSPVDLTCSGQFQALTPVPFASAWDVKVTGGATATAYQLVFVEFIFGVGDQDNTTIHNVLTWGNGSSGTVFRDRVTPLDELDTWSFQGSGRTTTIVCHTDGGSTLTVRYSPSLEQPLECDGQPEVLLGNGTIADPDSLSQGNGYFSIRVSRNASPSDLVNEYAFYFADGDHAPCTDDNECALDASCRGSRPAGRWCLGPCSSDWDCLDNDMVTQDRCDMGRCGNHISPTLRGRIVTDTGAPAVGIRVEAYVGTGSFEFTTDSNGAYVLGVALHGFIEPNTSFRIRPSLLNWTGWTSWTSLTAGIGQDVLTATGDWGSVVEIEDIELVP